MTYAVPRPSAERPWLVADIGGTNARFGLITRPGGRAERILVLRAAEHPDLESAVAQYLAAVGVTDRPSAMCAAVAGPVTGDRFRFTNGTWSLSVSETRNRLGVEELHLINDFEALALSLPHLREDDVLVIGDRRPDTSLPMAVLGPGTGLGVAGLVPIPGGGWVPLPGEGGHMLLRPGHGEDAEAIDVLRGERGGLGMVTAEHVLSGPGLTRLYRYVARSQGEHAEALSPPTSPAAHSRAPTTCAPRPSRPSAACSAPSRAAWHSRSARAAASSSPAASSRASPSCWSRASSARASRPTRRWPRTCTASRPCW